MYATRQTRRLSRARSGGQPPQRVLGQAADHSGARANAFAAGTTELLMIGRLPESWIPCAHEQRLG